MVWINAIVHGLLLGGLYALFATGLSLVFGVMRLVNLAHGDIMIGADTSPCSWEHSSGSTRSWRSY
jgi:branched-subunit amino acid ABC-type transport system permease component